MGIAYLSPEKSPYENFLMIAQYDARTTKAHADLLSRSQNSPPLITCETVKSLALGFFIGGVLTALFFSDDRKFGIGVSAAGIGLFLSARYFSESLDYQIQKEAEKSQKIYHDIFEMLARAYVHKANFVFEKVQKDIQEKKLKDIESIFFTVKFQVDIFDKGFPSYTTEEDLYRCFFYRCLQDNAIKLITGAKEIGPCLEFMTLSGFCWEFSYGVGKNPHVHWAPEGQMKRYFLEMHPSENGWTVRKHHPPILSPF
ncbi:MAG: hypothetical protein JSS10_05035 [Verrucomicrobia bacterium]|nr:hypothetical protein [Verrucomicrobiota bacterium]